MTGTAAFNIAAFGENGWIAQFADTGDMIALALHANKVAEKLRKEATVTDAVAGINSLAIRFDPAAVKAEDALAVFNIALDATPHDPAPAPAKYIEIPVCYGGESGPDFNDLCTNLNLTPAQLIEAHAAQTYRVLTLGFAPGFAYLGPLEPALRMPRLETPRQRVAAGSVGVVGAFTGVYPLPSPGGWRIIGRTPARLFDPHAPSPFLFEPGAEVRFVPMEGAAS